MVLFLGLAVGACRQGCSSSYSGSDMKTEAETVGFQESKNIHTRIDQVPIRMSWKRASQGCQALPDR
jgi:hypothetical protein